MPKFWSYITNGEYFVGCTGQTVYLFDKDEKEIVRFKKDITYGYTPLISPDGKLLVVKSTEGRMAVYSLESRSLIKKFRFSKVDCGQDDSFCFSPDSSEFYNIERHEDTLKTALSIYDTRDFSLKKRILREDFNTVLCEIEYDSSTDAYYILGFIRDKSSGVASEFFVGKLGDDGFEEQVLISSNERWFYRSYIHLKMMGFTEKAYKWSYMDMSLEELRKADHSLAKLFAYRKSVPIK